MKTKFTFVLLGLFMAIGQLSFASFPVERQTATINNVATDSEITENNAIALTSPAAVKLSEETWIAAGLWFFLGGFAAHRWYLGSPWYWNILFILTFGGLGVWWIIDGIDIFTENWN